MSLLKKLAGLAVGAAAVGAVAYVLQNRDFSFRAVVMAWRAIRR